MLTQTIAINNRVGLHSKPAALFVQCANRFASEIYVNKGATRVNAKSIMGVMILSVDQGDTVTLEVSGDDEAVAMTTLVDLIQRNFGIKE